MEAASSHLEDVKAYNMELERREVLIEKLVNKIYEEFYYLGHNYIADVSDPIDAKVGELPGVVCEFCSIS